MSQHRCFAEGCETACALEKLMCLRHWRMVSPENQAAVYAAWGAYERLLQQRGRVGAGALLDAYRVYRAAIHEARADVAREEYRLQAHVDLGAS